MFCDPFISIQQKLSCFSKYLTLDIQEPLLWEEKQFSLHWHPIVSFAMESAGSHHPADEGSSLVSHRGQINALVLQEGRIIRHLNIISSLVISSLRFFFFKCLSYPFFWPQYYVVKSTPLGSRLMEFFLLSSTHWPHDLAQDIVFYWISISPFIHPKNVHRVSVHV